MTLRKAQGRLVKICGMREVDHALVAAQAGADLLGFVFVPGVRRRLDVDVARSIIEEFRRASVSEDGVLDAGSPRIVGLFANQPLNEVNGIIARCGLDLAQLCGDEDSDYWRQVDADVIRQVRIDDTAAHDVAVADGLRRVEAATTAGCIPLLDKQEVGQLGGTGRTFDWSIAREIAARFDVLLAGGAVAGQRGAGYRGGVAVGGGRVERGGDGRREGSDEDCGIREGGAGGGVGLLDFRACG